MMLRLLRAWLPVVAMCAIIFALSQDSSSGRHSDAVLGWLLSLVGKDSPHLRHLLNPYFRKCAHVTVYFFLAAFTYRGFRMGRSGFQFAGATRSLLFSAAYAATDEYHQSFIAARGPSVRDVGIDTCGALLALVLIWLFSRSHARGDSPPPRPYTPVPHVIESP